MSVAAATSKDPNDSKSVASWQCCNQLATLFKICRPYCMFENLNYSSLYLVSLSIWQYVANTYYRQSLLKWHHVVSLNVKIPRPQIVRHTLVQGSLRLSKGYPRRLPKWLKVPRSKANFQLPVVPIDLFPLSWLIENTTLVCLVCVRRHARSLKEIYTDVHPEKPSTLRQYRCLVKVCYNLDDLKHCKHHFELFLSKIFKQSLLNRIDWVHYLGQEKHTLLEAGHVVQNKLRLNWSI